jgi:MoaA/NifB/PqqE/SkfB family radical SAM enzyme
MGGLRLLWLEVTGRCQLKCHFCYAGSGLRGTHGDMTVVDWRRIIDEAATIGTRDVTFIGGEPTLLPELPQLVQHAAQQGMAVEVYSNLARPISEDLWRIFALPGVGLATSYHAADPATHDRITTRRGSHRMTRMNIV